MMGFVFGSKTGRTSDLRRKCHSLIRSLVGLAIELIFWFDNRLGICF